MMMKNIENEKMSRRKFIGVAGMLAAAVAVPVSFALRKQQVSAPISGLKPPVKADASGCFRSAVPGIPR